MRTVLCVLLSMAAVFSNAQTVISLNGTAYSEVTMPRRDVEEVDDGIIVTYYFDNAIAQPDLLYPECVMWKIPGFGLNEAVGEPAIPFRWDSFSLPQNTRVNLEVLDSSFVDFSMQLSPSRPILMDSDTIEHTLDNVLPIAPYDGFFPTSLVKSSVGSAYRGVPLLDVGISPLQYDDERQVIRAYKMIKYKISFTALHRNANSTSSVIDVNDNYLSLATINSSSAINRARSMSEATDEEQFTRDYLIITNSTLRPIVEEFAEWKRTLGFRTSITVNDNWSIQAVKDAITQYYSEPNHNLYYLLIVGDESVVPAPMTTYWTLNKNDTVWYDYISDFSYACLDNSNDNVPDILYGRIPTDNISDAEIAFNKIRTYEENPIIDASFYNTGLNCAYFQDDTTRVDSVTSNPPDTYADRRFAQTSEEVLQYVTSQGKTVNRVYFTKSTNTPLYWNKTYYSSGEAIPDYLRKPEFPWDGDSLDIINYINQGTFYLLHRDHGNVNGWGKPAFKTHHIPSLSNQNKLPVVFSLNCLTGRYQHSQTEDCFAEAFIKNANGGCVAIYAATGVSYSGYNDALATGMFDAIWPNPGLRTVFPNSNNETETTDTLRTPTYELGEILEVGMARMKETWGATRTTGANITQEIFHLFGDPSMQIYTNCPTSIQTPDISRVGDTIYVEVKDGEARISFYTPSTQQVDTYNGTSASYHTTADDVRICISRHNYVPYVTNTMNQVYIQNETINTDRTYSGNIIKAGKNVTGKKAPGNVVINSGTVNMVGNRVELQAGTKVSKGAVLKIDNP